MSKQYPATKEPFADAVPSADLVELPHLRGCAVDVAARAQRCL